VTGSESANVRPLRRPAGSAPSAGRRFRANWPAELRIAGARIPCTVIDISSVGACLKLDEPLPKDGMLRLIIGNVPPIQVVPAWRKSAFLGVLFHYEQSWVLDSCGKRFDPTAWLNNV
jgi:hypothetical protein